MQPVSAFVVFVMIWWLVMFCVLPVGVQTTHEIEEDEKGIRAPGAPKTFNLKKKLLITTIISVVLWALTVTVIQMDIIDFREYAQQI